MQVFLTTTHIAIVMEYASGGELFEFVKRSGRLSEDAARFFFQQLISGVDYCHRQARAFSFRLRSMTLDILAVRATFGPWTFGYHRSHLSLGYKPSSRTTVSKWILET